MADAGQRISQYPEATELNGTDCFFEETATPKNFKVSWSTICDAIKAKFVNWDFTLKTNAKNLPGAVDELKTNIDDQKKDLTALSGKIDGALRYKIVTLSRESSTVLRGYTLFDKVVLSATATVEQETGTPFNTVDLLTIKPNYGGTGNRVEVYARGTGFVEGHVLKVHVIAITKDS